MPGLWLTPTRKTDRLPLPSVDHKGPLNTSESPTTVHHHHQINLTPILHPDTKFLLPLFTSVWIPGGNQPQRNDGYAE